MNWVIQIFLIFFLILFSSLFHHPALSKILYASDHTSEAINDQTANELPELNLQRGHTGAVNASIFSPDNRMIASAGTDGTVKIWDNNTGQLLRTIMSSNYWVYCLAFSPDGRFIATGSGDNHAHILEVSSGRKLITLKEHVHAVKAVAYSPDGKTLATGSRSYADDPDTSMISLWDVDSGEQLIHINFGGGHVSDLVFLQEGNVLAAATMKRDKSSFICAITLWDATTGELLNQFGKSTGWIYKLSVSQRENMVAAIVTEGNVGMNVLGDLIFSGLCTDAVRIWNLSSSGRVANFPFKKGSAKEIAIMPDDKSIVIANKDGKIGLFDIASQTQISELTRELEVGNSVSVSPGGQWIVSANSESIEVFNVATKRCMQKTSSQSIAIRDIEFIPADNMFAVAYADGSSKIWSMESGTPVRMYEGHKAAVHTLGFNPFGEMLMTAGYDHKLIFWDLLTGEPKLTIIERDIRIGHEKDNSLLGKRRELLTYQNIKMANIPAAPRHLRIIDGGPNPVDKTLLSCAYSPVDELVAFGGYETSGQPSGSYVNVLNLSNETLTYLYRGDFAEVRAVSFSPDGNTLAIGLEDGQFLLSKVYGKLLDEKIDGHVNPITAMKFSPDGSLLATAGEDNLVRLWDPVSKSPLTSLEAHNSAVLCLDFSPDGRYLASGDADNLVFIWDVEKDEIVHILKGHSSTVNTLAFSKKGEFLASGDEDGTLIFWDTSSYKLLASAVSFNEKDWFAFDKAGFFDGTRSAWKLATFRFPSEPFVLHEPEQYFNLFYQPDMLSDVLREGKPISQILRAQNDPRSELDIAAYRNSRLPEVRIDAPENGKRIAERKILIDIEAEDTGFGLRDLRVFRNQSLVHFEHGNLKPDFQTKAFRLNVPVKLVAGKNEITAYVFNHENIKSKDAVITITGADNLKRKGNAYIFCIGINEYSYPNYNLNYAVADADALSTELGQNLGRFSQDYGQVVPIRLFNQQATKANILAVLDLLAGKSINLSADAPGDFGRLKSAEPEDVLIIFFAGHGTANGDRYYLIPHDLGYHDSKEAVDGADRKTILSHSISDRELEDALEKIDAGRIMLIIDACQSGQALEAEEKRRGPMNSRGLAQLAYEKGMYVLAAAQSYQAALEFEKLGHGLLTYTLIEKGLREMAADTNPKDRRLTAREWLEYAVLRVPQETSEANERFVKKKKREIDFGEETVTGQAPRAYFRREITGGDWVIRQN